MLKTKSGLPKYCGWFHDRHGKRRVRFRTAGFSTFLNGTPWGEDFMRQYAAALDGVTAQTTTIGAERTKPGTLNALIASYYKAPEFRSLGESTQAHRRRIIEKFRAEYGDLYLKGLKRKHVADIIAAKAEQTPEAANNLVKLLRVIFKYAITLDMLESNPAADIKRYKSFGTGHHPWTEEEIAQFEATHAVGSKARLAQALLLFTGQRVGDVARMGWQHVTDDAIAVIQQKTGKALVIPFHPALKTILAALPRTNLTVCCDRARRAVHGAGSWRLVQETMPRCRVAALLGAWPTACRRNAAGQCRMRRPRDRSNHRPHEPSRGRPLHCQVRSSKAGTTGLEPSARGRK